MIENFNSKQMYGKRQNKAVIAAVSNNEEMDNVDKVLGIASGLTAEDEDIDDENIASVPEWNQMLDLLAERDGMTEEI